MRYVLVSIFLLLATLEGIKAVSPYAGQESQAIKALSFQEISDYLSGNGMGSSPPISGVSV